MNRVSCSDKFFIKRLISTKKKKKNEKKNTHTHKEKKDKKKERKVLFPLLVRFTL